MKRTPKESCIITEKAITMILSKEKELDVNEFDKYISKVCKKLKVKESFIRLVGQWQDLHTDNQMKMEM